MQFSTTMVKQQGFSLIITFIIMTVMLIAAVVLATLTIAQFKIFLNANYSVSSFNAADTGVEKTFYLSHIAPQTGQPGMAAGFCGICSACQSTTGDCNQCTYTPLAPGGCDTQCNNCKLTYTSTFDNRTFNVQATVTPNPSSPGVIFFIYPTGIYKETQRTSFFDSTK